MLGGEASEVTVWEMFINAGQWERVRKVVKWQIPKNALRTMGGRMELESGSIA